MNTQAIERIKGYCCEVTQSQWDELVRVADEVGVKVWDRTRRASVDMKIKFAFLDREEFDLLMGVIIRDRKVIPFPDFLAKLKGEEWQPKAGEIVEVKNGPKSPWHSVTFVGKLDGWNVCRTNNYEYDEWIDDHIRPIRPTITRAEAEQQLGKRIID